jgi:hypothetical protein
MDVEFERDTLERMPRLVLRAIVAGSALDFKGTETKEECISKIWKHQGKWGSLKLKNSVYDTLVEDGYAPDFVNEEPACTEPTEPSTEQPFPGYDPHKHLGLRTFQMLVEDIANGSMDPYLREVAKACVARKQVLDSE